MNFCVRTTLGWTAVKFSSCGFSQPNNNMKRLTVIVCYNQIDVIRSVACDIHK